MPIDYSQLKTELQTDPKVIGYAVLITQGNDQAVADLINARSGPGSASVFRNDVAPREIINAVASADFTAATQIIISKIQLMFQAAPLDCTLANVRGNLQGIFAASTVGTQNAVTAVCSRTGSRAEVLFGAGIVVSAGDVGKALRGVLSR